MPTIQLGRVGSPPHGAGDPRGRLVYLAVHDAVVLVERRHADAWQCDVIARRRGPCLPTHIAVSDADLAAAPSTLTVNPDVDPDGFALLWKAQVFRHNAAGRAPSLARKLADLVRTPGTLTITFGRSTLDTLSRSVHQHPVGVRRIVERLVGAQLLAAHDLQRPDLRTYTLALPPCLTRPAARP